jgi:cytochrome c biogenesis protein ResB
MSVFTGRGISRRTWRFLARTDVAAVLIVALALLAAVGSLFPQLSPAVAGDPERLARWSAVVAGRYGALAGPLAAVSVFRFFRSPVFLVPLGILALATLVCTLQRWPAVWRGVFRRLVTLLEHLAVLLLVLGALLSSLGWREEATAGPGETAAIGHGSGLTLDVDGFTISRYPDGSPADYVAEVVVTGGGQQTRHTIAVNRPLTYRGVNLYLSGYRQTQASYHVTLLAVRDPGYRLVVAAGILFLLGMVASFLSREFGADTAKPVATGC